ATLIQTIRAERSRNNNNLPLYLHTDACQAPNYLDMHVTRLGVDLMTLNGGKIYGPKQSGVLFVASHVRLAPLIHGGGQERDLRSGTENVAQAIGFALALENAQAQRKAESVRLAGLQRKIWSVIKKDMPSVRLNGSLHRRLPNNIHLTFSGHDNEKLLMQLEEAGFLVAVGSACSASSEEPNHVLRAMGISGVDAQSSLRITLGRDTTESGIDSFLAAIQNIVSANN
ncbi:aminotransferase class V-fold PLP-dependent enzyme, partial [Candidatus Saccharibacteria bacterium]|nr:aminotransferase class V-fold PLP-dependent enzyme [Candidatus Saccharibacteria bacterium]